MSEGDPDKAKEKLERRKRATLQGGRDREEEYLCRWSERGV